MNSIVTFLLGSAIGVPIGFLLFAILTLGKRADVMDQEFTGDQT